MGATHRTDHYDLSQYQGSDKPSYLLDYNSDMAKIDAALYAASTTATEAGDKLHNEVEPTLESTKTRSEQNSAELVTVKADVQQNASNITMLTNRVNTIDNKTELLEDAKQNKALTSPVVIEGQTYATVEAAIAALAQYGGGDLNEYQKKRLTSPVVIEGQSYLTVESAIAALAQYGGGGGTVYLPGFDTGTTRVHRFDVNTSTTGFQYDNYTVAEDGYYMVEALFQTNASDSMNASGRAAIRDSEGTELYELFSESANNTNILHIRPNALFYCKAGQQIRLQAVYFQVSGSPFTAYMDIYYTKGAAVNGAGGGGDLSAYQTKALVTPLVVDGTTYTTVESAMAAINALAASGGGGTGTSNYNNLSNKPSINGVELTGNKTSADLHIEGGGTTDYTDLSNKPSINGVTLSGNKSAADLGISGSAEYIRNNPTTTASSAQWADWQQGSVSSGWITDNNSFVTGIIRVAKGATVVVGSVKIGGTTVAENLRFTHKPEGSTSAVDTSDYQDFLIPFGCVAKGVDCRLDSVQRSDGSVSTPCFKLRIYEADMS